MEGELERQTQKANEQPPHKDSMVSSEGAEPVDYELEERKRQDAKAIFIENVDYKTTKEELELIFEDCGVIERVTIMKNHITKQPKGCAYLSFNHKDGV